MSLGPTRRLSKYVEELTFDKIPKKTTYASKKYILDLIGVALAGSKAIHSRITADLVRELGGKKEATVFSYGYKVPCNNAAFANGVMAHAIDFDDTHDILHPGCSIITAALAIAEREKTNGRDLIAAIVAGYDVSARVALSVNPWHRKRGYHPTGTCNCFGVAAAVGKILGLNEKQQNSAFGIAGTQAAGLTQYHVDGTMLKHFHAGRAAQSGVIAAQLAQKGFTGSDTILEGDYGFCKVLSDEYDLSVLTAQLGERFEIVNTSIKPYPSCRHTHGPIDAALELARQYKVEPNSIKEVILRIYAPAATLYDKSQPDTVLQAILSLQYSIACALMEGSVLLKHYTDKKIKDKKIREFLKKIKVKTDNELTKIYPQKWPCILEVIMNSGKKLSYRVDYPKGSPENPLSEGELNEKFKSLALEIFTEKQVNDIIRTCKTLETLKDINELTALLE